MVNIVEINELRDDINTLRTETDTKYKEMVELKAKAKEAQDAYEAELAKVKQLEEENLTKVKELNNTLNHYSAILDKLQGDFINNSRVLKDLYHIIELGADTLEPEDKLVVISTLEEALIYRRKLVTIFNTCYNPRDIEPLIYENVRVDAPLKLSNPMPFISLSSGNSTTARYACRSTATVDTVPEMLAKIPDFNKKLPKVITDVDDKMMSLIKGGQIGGYQKK